MKRVLDIIGAAIGLLLLGWTIALAAIIARGSTGGSGLFVQPRVGLHGKTIGVIKIRTMRSTNSLGSTVTSKLDTRITKFGRLMRKTKIDELPQLINVFKGDMSFVGPRPTVQEDYDKMDSRQKERCGVLPGITGLAQISGNTSLLWPDRIEYDLKYVEMQTVWLDGKILFLTAWSIFSGRSDTHPAGDDEWVA
jgi:lipopolysaccharide/colanic/teichoic acid biosynthesis glycosyltransferase